MKVWDIKPTDVIRFVLRRSEWHVLIDALAGNAAWIDGRGKLWKALDVLRTAEVDINASAMTSALTQIAEYTKGKRDNESIIIHQIAMRGLETKQAEEETRNE